VVLFWTFSVATHLCKFLKPLGDGAVQVLTVGNCYVSMQYTTLTVVSRMTMSGYFYGQFDQLLRTGLLCFINGGIITDQLFNILLTCIVIYQYNRTNTMHVLLSGSQPC
jgi:hypothetical protein